MKKYFAYVLVLFLCAACIEDKQEVQIFWGAVRDIRVTRSRETVPAQPGDPVGGAVVGAVIAGTPGAVLGAAVGQSDGHPAISGEVLACGFSISIDGHTMDFRTSQKDTSLHCSLLRAGDSMRIVKVIRTYERDRVYVETTYEWRAGGMSLQPELIR